MTTVVGRQLPRRPDWRWTRVVELSQYTNVQALARMQHDDEIVRELFQFKRELDKGFADPNTVLSEAHTFFLNWPVMKMQLEGYLLAGADNSRVAQHLGCSEQTVQMYHDAFFDIRWALNSKNDGWIVAAVFGTVPHHGTHSHDTLGLVHRVAWYGGLEMMERYFTRGLCPEQVQECMQRFMQDVMGKHVIETIIVKPNSEDDVALIKLVSDGGKREDTKPKLPHNDDVVDKFIGSLALSVADVSCADNVALPGRELRDSEILAALKPVEATVVTG